jgi:hypothetical protein
MIVWDQGAMMLLTHPFGEPGEKPVGVRRHRCLAATGHTRRDLDPVRQLVQPSPFRMLGQ